MAEIDRLVGREHVLVLARELMERPLTSRHRRSVARPILVVEGARGSGKTSLCAVLAEAADQHVPYARLDLDRAAGATTPDLLSALAFQLSRACPIYGTVDFPRFAIGRLVMADGGIDISDRLKARRQIVALLEKHRHVDAVRELLAETAGAALDTVQATTRLPVEPIGKPLVKSVIGGIVAGAEKVTRGRVVVLGKYQDWFGHRGRGLPNQSLDVLVDLNVRARDTEDEENAEWIRDLLWDAFLTDLSAHFAAGRRTTEMTLNALALLDNADGGPGQELVAGLTRARRDRALAPDPLTMIVTSRGGLLYDVPAHEVADYPSDDRPAQEARALGRLRLGDLTEDDTRRMVQLAGLWTGHTMRLPALAYGLSSGHPASTRLLVDAAVAHPGDVDAPEALLASNAPRSRDERIGTADRMLSVLLGDFPADLYEDLVTCSAAADQHHARALVAGPLVQIGDSSYAEVRAVLWPESGGAGPQVLRRLLLRELDGRPAGHDASWRAVFGWHRDARTRAGDQDGALYYALAHGDVADVVDGVAGWMTLLSAEAWLGRLRAVTAAPRRRPPGDEIPSRQVLTHLRRTPAPGRVELARLVIGHWIAADPLIDSRRHGLHLQLASDFEAVARTYPDDDVEPLLRAARQHRRTAEYWN